MANYSVSYSITAIDNFSKIAQEIKDSVAGIENSLKKMTSQASRAESRLEKFGNAAKKLGRNLSLYVSTPLAAEAGLALKQFMAFDVAMRATGAITGATAEQYTKLKNQTFDLALTTTFSAAKIADAQRIAFGRIQDVNKVLEVMPVAAKLALGTMGDLKQTTFGLSMVMYIWEKQGLSASHMANVMAEAFKQTGQSADLLASAFSYAGPQARDAGMSFDEAASALITVAKAEKQPTKAGMQMRQILGKLEAPTAKMNLILHMAAKKYHANAAAIMDSTGRMKDFYGMMALLAKMKPGAFAKIIPDVRAKEFAQLVVQHQAAAQKLYASMHGIGNVVDMLAEVQMAGLTGSFRGLTQALGILNLKFIESQQGGLKWMIDKMVQFVRWADRSDKTTQSWITGIWDAGIVLGPVVTVMGKFVLFLALIASRVPAAATALRILGVSFKFLWLRVLGPIGLIWGAGEALDWLYNKFDWVRSALDKLGDSAAKVFGPFGSLGKLIFQPLKVKSEEMLGKMGLDPHLFGDIGMPAAATIPANNKISKVAAEAHSNYAKMSHSVQSKLDITVDDPKGYVKTVKGSSTGAVGLNVFQNMYGSRA